METKQLYKIVRGEDNTEVGQEDFSPATLITSVYDPKHMVRLDKALAFLNHWYVPYTGDDIETYNKLDESLRHAGVIVTYRTLENNTFTRQYVGESYNNTEWSKLSNWVNYPSEYYSSTGGSSSGGGDNEDDKPVNIDGISTINFTGEVTYSGTINDINLTGTEDAITYLAIYFKRPHEILASWDINAFYNSTEYSLTYYKDYQNTGKEKYIGEATCTPSKTKSFTTKLRNIRSGVYEAGTQPTFPDYLYAYKIVVETAKNRYVKEVDGDYPFIDSGINTNIRVFVNEKERTMDSLDLEILPEGTVNIHFVYELDLTNCGISLTDATITKK